VAGSFYKIAERNRDSLRLIQGGAIIMFETAVQEKHSGMLWGVIIGVVALVVLLGTGYVLIT
jgi:hypothetical protein